KRMIFMENNKRIKNNGIKVGTLSSFKSAAVKFRTLNGFPAFSDEEQAELARYLKGVKNQNSTKVRQGTMKSEEGKRHLKYAEYQDLCLKSMQSTTISRKSSTECHLAMVLLWNLTAR